MMGNWSYLYMSLDYFCMSANIASQKYLINLAVVPLTISVNHDQQLHMEYSQLVNHRQVSSFIVLSLIALYNSNPLEFVFGQYHSFLFVF